MGTSGALGLQSATEHRRGKSWGCKEREGGGDVVHSVNLVYFVLGQILLPRGTESKKLGCRYEMTFIVLRQYFPNFSYVHTIFKIYHHSALYYVYF